MNRSELIDYIKRVKNAEMAIFTHRELMKKHMFIIEEEKPIEPRESFIAEWGPTMQKPIRYEAGKGWMRASFFFAVLGLLMLVAKFIKGSDVVISFFLLFEFVAIMCIIRHGVCKNKESESEYECEEYSAFMEDYKRERAKIEEGYKKRYIDELAVYNKEYPEYVSRKENADIMHNEALTILENNLEELYSQDVVFPKYRNLVSICMIEEYLASGRCDTLEGASGAYNLYEMELRQNIIIGQLSSIVENIEQIKDNQFSLYQAISAANKTVDGILEEVKAMKADTQLTAYFAEITAKAAASPTYIKSI